MKINQWTTGLAAAGVISLAAVASAEEAKNQVLTAVSSTTISGYVSTSARWDLGSKGSVSQYIYGGTTASPKSDGFNLDVVNLTVSKNVSEGDWGAGYKAELVFGPDAAALATGSPVKQAYVEVRAPLGNGLNVKLGVFDTPTGYEVFNSPENPNYTRSWANTLESTVHTGVLASYKFNDVLSAQAGVANTTDNVINGRSGQGPGPVLLPPNQSQKTYIGLITLTAPESLGFLKGGTLTACVIDGRTSGATTGPDTTAIYVGATVPTPIAALTVGAAYDHFNHKGAVDQDAMALYLSYKCSDKCKLNLRGEYFDYPDPVRKDIASNAEREIKESNDKKRRDNSMGGMMGMMGRGGGPMGGAGGR